MAPLDDNARPFYFKQAGHCTRCREPFGHNATAYMVREKVAWRVLSYVAFTQWETAPVCDACVCVSEHAVLAHDTTCAGCGQRMRVGVIGYTVATVCSNRC